jgi:hypothetical protein
MCFEFSSDASNRADRLYSLSLDLQLEDSKYYEGYMSLAINLSISSVQNYTQKRPLEVAFAGGPCGLRPLLGWGEG